MKTPKHLFSTSDIAAAIQRNGSETVKFLKKHNIKPVREVKTEHMVFRQYSKSALETAISIANETFTRRKQAPTQAPLLFDEKQEAVKQVEFWQKSLGVDIDKAHTHALPTEAPVEALPKIDIPKLIEEGQNRSEEMMSVLRSIDDRLAQLVAIWSK